MRQITEAEYLEALEIIKQYESQQASKAASASTFSEDLKCSKNLKELILKHNVTSVADMYDKYQNRQMMAWAGFGKKLLVEVEKIFAEHGFTV